jgi:hypothetical protein
MPFDTLDEARKMIPNLATQVNVPLHSIILTSDRGHERWFKLDGVWRRTGL